MVARDALFTHSSSPDLNTIVVATLSLSAHRWSQIWQDPLHRGRGEDATFTWSSSTTEQTHYQRIPIRMPCHCRLGRAFDPVFLAAVVWADPASRRPPSQFPTNLRYNFLQNRPCSTTPGPYVDACESFSTSQPPS